MRIQKFTKKSDCQDMDNDDENLEPLKKSFAFCGKIIKSQKCLFNQATTSSQLSRGIRACVVFFITRNSF